MQCAYICSKSAPNWAARAHRRLVGLSKQAGRLASRYISLCLLQRYYYIAEFRVYTR
jgi:hypothetical protein